MFSPWRWNLQARSAKVLCPHSSQALDVRLGFSLCQAELEFLQKRRVVVAQALKEVLQLEEDLRADEVGERRSAPSQTCSSKPCLPAGPCSPSHAPGQHCLSRGP